MCVKEEGVCSQVLLITFNVFYDPRTSPRSLHHRAKHSYIKHKKVTVEGQIRPQIPLYCVETHAIHIQSLCHNRTSTF